MNTRDKQTGQAIVLAAVSLVAMVGMLAFVIDVGLLLMIRSQLTNASDAAALAGIMAWQPGVSDSTNEDNARNLASKYIDANKGILDGLRLCNGGVKPPSFAFRNILISSGGQAPSMTVTLTCDAGLVFGLILWQPGSAPNYAISADATAMQGCIDTDGEVVAFQSPCVVTPPPNQPSYGARLIPTPS